MEYQHRSIEYLARGNSFLVFLIMLLPALTQSQVLDVPFVATPQEVVEEMLDLASVGPGDYVVDLGSGDGRIVIAAAKRGAVGHGVDLDPELVTLSLKNAKDEGVDDRVTFFEENVFETDFSMATVVTMYLLTSINVELRPELFKQLLPGTRVISHVFDMADWQPDQRSQVNYHNIYYWVIPADFSGKWAWQIDNKSFQMNVDQTFQNIDQIFFNTGSDYNDWGITDAKIQGDRITIIAEQKKRDERHVYNGILVDSSIKGSVQIHEGKNRQIFKWEAVKIH